MKSPHTLPARLPAWPAWTAAAVLALLTGYFVFMLSQREAQLTLSRDAQALTSLQLESLSTALESERIVSQQQIVQLKDAEARLAALSDRLKHTQTPALTQASQLKTEIDITALRISSLHSRLDSAPAAAAIAVWNSLGQEGVLTVSHLPAPAPDKDYQLWITTPQYAIPVSGGVFTVDTETGKAHFIFKPDQPIKIITALAVSLEDKGGAPKAEGPMVLISQ